MTDRELLEAAAKAAELGEVWYLAEHSDTPYIGPRFELGHPVRYKVWNPLTDDGDALRLAVKLGLIVDAGAHRASDGMGAWSAQTGERDGYSATRRAIVRAAAAMASK